MMLAQAKAIEAQSNWQSRLGERSADLAAVSNRLEATARTLAATQKDLQRAQSAALAASARVTELESASADLHRQINVLEPLQQRVAALQDKLAHLTTERDRAAEEAHLAMIEKAGLEHRLRDPHFLGLQVESLENQAKLAQRVAADPQALASDSRARLQLQPDGTVKLVASTNVVQKRR